MTDRDFIQSLLTFIDASPSPWHAVATVENLLTEFSRHSKPEWQRLDEKKKWRLLPGGRYYVVRDQSSIVLFTVGDKPLVKTGFKIIGAHTDSPGLRIKPKPALFAEGVLRLGVEVYGGPILATFTDRDLSLAGRIGYVSGQSQIASRLIRFDEALLRLPNLAIHMNREVNEQGLKLHRQLELPLLLSCAEEQFTQAFFMDLLQRQSGIDAERILSWDLNVYDTQPGAVWGARQEFYADSQLDNLASCHAALNALLDEQVLRAGNTLVCAFFDHEEIGSNSNRGADGSFLPDLLQRIAYTLGSNTEDYQRTLAGSFLVSADMAHAFQPNFPNAYEPDHKVMVNQGPVIKVNASHRYSSESLSQAQFAAWCEQAEVPYQKYSHRTDLPCGSTIGPLTSAQLGIRAVDVGNPMWAMHSIRESAGVFDHDFMIRVLKQFFRAGD